MDPEAPVVVLVLPKWVALNLPTKPALKPKFNWVVDCKPAKLPEFCYLPPTLRGANMTFGFIPPTLRPMAAMGVPPGDVVIALGFRAATAAAVAAMGIPLGDKVMLLAFTVTAAAAATLTFRGGGGGGLQHCSIARRELGLIKLCKY